ncbi:MAG: 2-oxoglutarate dehydrogenase E1 component, partial [Flavobacteriales bacterium]
DEPRYTQPLLYKIIANHPDPRTIYVNKLLSEGVLEAEMAKDMEKKFQDELNDRLAEAKEIEKSKITSFLKDYWEGFRKSTDEDFLQSPETGADKKSLLKVAKALYETPSELKFIKKIDKELEKRKTMITESNQLDWGMCELLAYGSLMMEGHPIRFTGQDVERGTFSHRHAVLKVEESEQEYCNLNNIDPKQPAKLHIYNSLLSEYGVLGFEYGYALSTPNTLTIWEAQFGDFNNGAQIIIDQFISATEDKWKCQNGLVMLMPHGYEGQGAEHSSARLERFLQLAARNNMQIVNASTPANFFHVLRRQLKREFRKPLMVFTPKKLLRFPACVSPLEDLTSGRFQEVIDDVNAKAANIDTVMFCSGKVYYDYMDKKAAYGDSSNIAIVRIEQMYPFPQEQVDKIVAKYKKAERHIWIQEEPENMGAWSFMLRKFKGVKLDLISIPESAAPATGSSKRHEKRVKTMFDKIFSYAKTPAATK